jgi:hypothetical protein
VLAVVGALPLVPLAVMYVRSPIWRGVHTALAVVLAAFAAGIAGSALPLSARVTAPLGLAGSNDAGAVATALGRGALDRPEVLLAATVLGVFAALLPLAPTRSLWALAGLGAAALAALLLPVPPVQAVPVVAGIWLCCAVVGVRAVLGGR